MPDQPDAQQLLDVARESVLALVADVHPRHHYALRMVANAMAIARREMAAPPPPFAGDALWREVMACDAGDADAQQALHADLVAVTRAALAVSNPKFTAVR